jgi:oxygen-dependent protoporphyrinogen oxidase
MRDAGSLAGAVRTLRGGGERSGSAVATLEGGLHTMVGPLVDAVRNAGGTVRTGARVTDLVRERDHWRVETSGGPAVRTAAVVLALPAPRAAGLLESVTPAISTAALRAPITAVLICTLLIDDPRLDSAPRGTGVLVSTHAGGVQAKALTHATAKWPWLARLAGPGRHVLRLSYGRGDTLPDASGLASVGLDDAVELLGVALTAGSVVDSAVVRWTAALPAPRPGHAESVRALRAALGPLGLSVVGAAAAGSGLAGVVADARLQSIEVSGHLDAVAGVAPGSSPGAVEPSRG